MPFILEKTTIPFRYCMNWHHFTTTVSNPDLPVTIHTQSHQIPFQEYWSVSVVHKLPDSTPDHIPRQFETAYQLILKLCHTPDSTSINHPPPLAPAALTIFSQSHLFYCWRRPHAGPKASPPFPNYLLSVGSTTWTSYLSKCRSVSPIIFIIICLSRFSLLLLHFLWYRMHDRKIIKLWQFQNFKIPQISVLLSLKTKILKWITYTSAKKFAVSELSQIVRNEESTKS